MTSNIKRLFSKRTPLQNSADKEPGIILDETHLEKAEQDRLILEGDSGGQEERLQREVDKTVRNAAKVSLRKLHVIQKGRCPACGEHLSQHLSTHICESCGWNTFDTPRQGPVAVHLSNNEGCVEGERCYVVEGGAVLVLKDGVVNARIPAKAVSWIEYQWNQKELDQRQRQQLDRLDFLCGWCNKTADPDKDGFHVAHVALGSTQERYCFCSDECYEAFRKMYPARVDRDCYERDCATCSLCIKRYEDETDGVRLLAKDYLHIIKKRT